ncbi:MAG TPA: hypothetical protein HA257_02740 [Candidatus Methanoperedenaceae archaeon]|nr:hypothetical protein [Candidatus Methanoperedenaceae archaeon]
MDFEGLLERLDFISKAGIRSAAGDDVEGMIADAKPDAKPSSQREKMVLGYLTTICAEKNDPAECVITRSGIDYAGIELERGTLVIRGDAGDRAGTTMKGGKLIIDGSAGVDTGRSMSGGEIHAKEIRGIGPTLGGRIYAEKAGSVAPGQKARIFIAGKPLKTGILGRLGL